MQTGYNSKTISADDLPYELEMKLSYMLQELKGNRLEVYKIPSRQGGLVRAVLSHNCEWYKQLCASYERPRKGYPRPRTIIRRFETIRVLERMLKTGKLNGVYAERILDIAKSYLAPCEVV